MDELHCRIETSFEPLASFRSTWDEAVIRLGGSIYMSYDWCRAWWRFYGENNNLRILIFYAGVKVVGILPLYVSSLGFRPFHLKVARLIGSNIPPKVFNPPIDQEHAGRIFEHMVAHLLGAEKCQVISLGPISEKYGQHILKAAGNHKSQTSRITIDECGVHSIFELPGTYEQYFKSLTKKERKNNKNRYDLSLLMEEHSAHEEIVSSPEDVMREYEPFVQLHTQEWQNRGGTGHYLSWPDGIEFNRTALSAQALLGQAEFVRIVVKGQTIASIYGYYSGGVFYAELMGRDMDRKWDKYNLGRTIVVRAVAQAINRGCKLVDAGLGHYDYKERLNAQEHTVFRIRCLSTQMRDRLLVMVFNFIRTVLLIGYHKIWYRRIRKLLPFALRKPQARLWLRFDF